MKKEAIRAQDTGESGFGFIETMVASVILLVGLMAVLGLFAVSMTQEHEQGSVNSRATTYCQAKMEELQALNFGDTTTNTTSLTWPSSGVGTGLGGVAASGSYGAVPPTAAAAGYVDYLDFQGTPVTAAAVDANGQLRQFFVRQWMIQVDGTGNIMTITVCTTARRRLGGGAVPFVTLVSLKSR